MRQIVLDERWEVFVHRAFRNVHRIPDSTVDHRSPTFLKITSAHFHWNYFNYRHHFDLQKNKNKTENSRRTWAVPGTDMPVECHLCGARRPGSLRMSTVFCRVRPCMRLGRNHVWKRVQTAAGGLQTQEGNRSRIQRSVQWVKTVKSIRGGSADSIIYA